MTADLFVAAAPGERTALHASTCPDCGRTAFPRVAECLACGGGTEPVLLAGPATLRALTSVASQPPGALVQAPYDVGVAQFPEGICVIGLIDGHAEHGATVTVVATSPYPDGLTFAFRQERVIDRGEQP
jgi:uncharacterized OB-fold protein